MLLLLEMLASTEAVPNTETPVGKSSMILLIQDIVTWGSGKRTCNALGGDLVSLRSAEEVTMIKKTLLQRYGRNQGKYWIGINDIDKDGIYSWSDGSKLTYENWISKEAEGYCGYAVWTEMISGWYTASCNEMYLYFICRIWQ